MYCHDYFVRLIPSVILRQCDQGHWIILTFWSCNISSSHDSVADLISPNLTSNEYIRRKISTAIGSGRDDDWSHRTSMAEQWSHPFWVNFIQGNVNMNVSQSKFCYSWRFTLPYHDFLKMKSYTRGMRRLKDDMMFSHFVRQLSCKRITFGGRTPLHFAAHELTILGWEDEVCIRHGDRMVLSTSCDR